MCGKSVKVFTTYMFNVFVSIFVMYITYRFYLLGCWYIFFNVQNIK